MIDDIPVTTRVDARGTRCPIPLLRAKQALKQMNIGEVLEVLATDPSAKPDFDAMLKHLPHKLVGYVSDDAEPPVARFLIKKG